MSEFALLSFVLSFAFARALRTGYANDIRWNCTPWLTFLSLALLGLVGASMGSYTF